MEPNAILAINSLDRYTKASQPIVIPNPPYPDIVLSSPALNGTALVSQFLNKGQQCNNFTIQSPGALIYGYIKKIQISQTQLQYNIPTVIPDKNDYIQFYSGNSEDGYDFNQIRIPYGYYTPEELSAAIQIKIRELDPIFASFEVTYSPFRGFTFNTYSNGLLIYFVPIVDVVEFVTSELTATVLRSYRLIGMNELNAAESTANEIQTSSNTPVFLYTPYIDVCSQTLTKYQKIKDTDSSPSKLSSIVARIYLSGAGAPQAAAGDLTVFPLGSRPFTVIQDCNTPKVIRWSRDEAVNTLDFQLYDQYGDLIYQQEGRPGTDYTEGDVYFTEFQMSLMCIEGERG
jgi:hypothetical protein